MDGSMVVLDGLMRMTFCEGWVKRKMDVKIRSMREDRVEQVWMVAYRL
jgi:hypothetical protein